jgi:hypothetical protein
MIMKRFAFLTYVGVAGFASGQFVYTENGGDNFWANRFNWRFGVIDPAGDYPNGFTGGVDLEVEIPRGEAVLSEPIRVGMLELATNTNNQSATVDLSGQSLTVEGDLTSFGISMMENGTLTANRIILNDGGIMLDGMDVTVAETEMAHGLSLRNGSHYRISESLLISNDSGITAGGAGCSSLAAGTSV